VYFDARRVRASIYRREHLGAGSKLATPCIVTEYSATTIVPAGTAANLDRFGNLILSVDHQVQHAS
jgi:N-methylhydantoinase A